MAEVAGFEFVEEGEGEREREVRAKGQVGDGWRKWGMRWLEEVGYEMVGGSAMGGRWLEVEVGWEVEEKGCPRMYLGVYPEPTN